MEIWITNIFFIKGSYNKEIHMCCRGEEHCCACSNKTHWLSLSLCIYNMIYSSAYNIFFPLAYGAYL